MIFLWKRQKCHFHFHCSCKFYSVTEALPSAYFCLHFFAIRLFITKELLKFSIIANQTQVECHFVALFVLFFGRRCFVNQNCLCEQVDIVL